MIYDHLTIRGLVIARGNCHKNRRLLNLLEELISSSAKRTVFQASERSKTKFPDDSERTVQSQTTADPVVAGSRSRHLLSAFDQYFRRNLPLPHGKPLLGGSMFKKAQPNALRSRRPLGFFFGFDKVGKGSRRNLGHYRSLNGSLLAVQQGDDLGDGTE